MPLVERRYRRLLAAYPADWRAANADAVLGTLLDAAEDAGRQAPTPREITDIAFHSARMRLASAMGVEERAAVASIAAGLGIGFAIAYFGVFIGPTQGRWAPGSHVGPIAILVAWALVGGVVAARPNRAALRLPAVLLAAAVPVLAFELRGAFAAAGSVTGWARPSNANAAFLVGLALLAAVGPIHRRLALRVAVAAAVGFALAFWLTGAGSDPYDQALWGSANISNGGAPGTLQTIVGFPDGRMPAFSATGPSMTESMRVWLQGTVLRLGIVQAAAVAVALITAAVLTGLHRRAGSRVLLVLTLPFLTALAVCAAQAGGVWFQ